MKKGLMLLVLFYHEKTCLANKKLQFIDSLMFFNENLNCCLLNFVDLMIDW